MAQQPRALRGSRGRCGPCASPGPFLGTGSPRGASGSGCERSAAFGHCGTRSSPSYSWRAAAGSRCRTARSTGGAAARTDPAGGAPRTPRRESAPPAGTQRPRQPGPGPAAPPPPRRAAPLTLAARLVRARCTFCWNWRCRRGSSARSGAALTALPGAGASAAMAASTSIAVSARPPEARHCPRAGARCRPPSPSNGRPGPPAARRERGPRSGHGRGGEPRPWESSPAPRQHQPSLGTLPNRPALRLRALRRGRAGGAGQSAPAERKAPRRERRQHHVRERDVRGAAGSARPGPGHPRGAGAGTGGHGRGRARGCARADGALCPQEIRKVVQALEQTAREMLTLLQGVHQGPGFQHSESRTAPGCGSTRGREGPAPLPGLLVPVPASPGGCWRGESAAGRFQARRAVKLPFIIREHH